MSADLIPMSERDRGNIRFFDCIEGDECCCDGGDVEFCHSDGHAGVGWYAWCGEYPEDGSAKLTPPSDGLEPVKVDGEWFWRALLTEATP